MVALSKSWSSLGLAFCVAHASAAAIIPRASNSSARSAVKKCEGYDYPRVLCLDRYASVLNPDFRRPANNELANPDKLTDTVVPSDPHWDDIKKADFVVFDEKLAAEFLGTDDQLEFLFEITAGGHEAPVYAPNTNEFYFSDLATGVDGLSQQVIDLSTEPPTLGRVTADPPIYAPAGARYRKGLIYYSTAGGNTSLDGLTYRPGVVSFDPITKKSEVLVNNYYGYYFNTADDLDIDEKGGIWITDLQYGRSVGLNTEWQQLEAATYRFDQETGSVSLVEDSLGAPNGVSFSPDFKTLYLTDSNADWANTDPTVPNEEVQYLTYNTTGKRTIYAYDVDETQTVISNKRAIYLAVDFVPDGLKVAENGYLVTSTGHGIDVLTPKGVPILRIQTNYTTASIDFGGPDYDQLFIVGHGGVSRVKWGLKGQAFK
ncbi:hypothetical protein N8T08_007206 [Aspergillus melleus]|uniref:Uncharacterized protein n=1 Tax=Aspergillus melleus TaxID=138277 RepID=A0ACC3AY97_9EURO|nr:hypothetical protein N8T08_007206 [Aspergillus melleus]